MKKSLKVFEVHIKFKYMTNDIGTEVVTKDVVEVEFAQTKQKLLKMLKKKFRYSTILELEIIELI